MLLLKNVSAAGLILLIACLAPLAVAGGDEQPVAAPVEPAAGKPADKPAGKPAEAAGSKEPAKRKDFAPPEGMTRLSKKHRIWVDVKKKQVLIDGYVALNDGQLEMFACPAGSKEHESLIAVHSTAKLAHTALLATGALSGNTVKFTPTYMPATGTVVEIDIQYHDANGAMKTIRAQEWVKNIKTGKEMQLAWVFAGSGFWQDPQDGKRYYHADGGDFICVSNFPTATLDLPVKSSQANNNLLFRVFKERVPPRLTPVRLVLKPQIKKLKPIATSDGNVKPDDPFNKKPLKDPFKN